MMPSLHLILLILIGHISSSSPGWVPHKGIWYYISSTRGKVSYKNAIHECESRSSRLATIVDDDQYDALKQATKFIQRWVGLSTIHTNHTARCSSADVVWAGDFTCAVNYVSNRTKLVNASCSAYTISGYDSLEVQNCLEKFGYICQWQCSTLWMKSRKVPSITDIYNTNHYQSNRISYQSARGIAIAKSFVYERKGCNHDHGNGDYCEYQWTLKYNGHDSVYNSFDDYVPYNNSLWYLDTTNHANYTNIYSICLDCTAYEITYINWRTNTHHTSIVRKKNEFEFADEDDIKMPIFRYDFESSSWCYSQNGLSPLCVKNGIFPVQYKLYYSWRPTQQNVHIVCVAMSHHGSIDVDKTLTSSPSTQFVSTVAKLESVKPESTTENGIVTTHMAERVNTSPQSTHMQSASEFYSEYSSSPTTNLFDNTQDHYIRTTPTTLVNLYSQTDMSHSDAKTNVQDNLKTTNDNMYMYIGIGFGVMCFLGLAIIIGVIVYKRRNTFKGNTETVTQNLDDVHVITDTNIYTEQPSFRDPSRVAYMQAGNGVSNVTNTTCTAPNIPPRNHVESTRRGAPEPDTNDDSIFQSHNRLGGQGDSPGDHGSNTDAHGSSNMPIYSEVNKHRKPVPPVPTEPVCSQMSNNDKTIKDSTQHNRVNGSDSDIEFCDNDVYEKVPRAAAHVNSGDNSDEEFSDNELYERGTSAPVQRNTTTTVRTNVFESIAFNVDPDDENIEMVDNDVYGQR